MKKRVKKKTDTRSESYNEDKVSESVEQLGLEELSGHNERSTLELSETDEDEDEGVGDGNIGRSTGNTLDNK